jgi:hypothetical protein
LNNSAPLLIYVLLAIFNQNDAIRKFFGGFMNLYIKTLFCGLLVSTTALNCMQQETDAKSTKRTIEHLMMTTMDTAWHLIEKASPRSVHQSQECANWECNACGCKRTTKSPKFNMLEQHLKLCEACCADIINQIELYAKTLDVSIDTYAQRIAVEEDLQKPFKFTVMSDTKDKAILIVDYRVVLALIATLKGGSSFQPEGWEWVEKHDDENDKKETVEKTDKKIESIELK